MEGMGVVTSLASMLNPVFLVTAAIVGLAFGYEHLVTSESRAAEEHLKEIERLGDLQPKVQQLNDRLLQLDAIQKSGKSSVAAKKAAEEEEKTIIEQLVSIYPNFMKFLYDEYGKRRDISEAIRLENKDRLENAKRTVEEAQAHLANAKALLEERKQRAESARYAPGGPGGAGVAKSATQGYLNAAIADSEEAIKIEDKALQQALQNLQKLQQANTDAKTKAPNLEHGDKSVKESGVGKAQAAYDRWLNEERRQWAQHQQDMVAIMDDGLDKQVASIRLKYDKMYETEKSFGADDATLLAIRMKEYRDIEQARTDWAKKQAEERKKIAEEEAKAARAYLEQYGTAQQGFLDGIQTYIQRQGTVFQQWSQAAQQMLQGVESAFSRGFQGILSGQMSLAQGLKSIWQGITGAIVQMLAQLAAKWIVTAIAAKIFKDSASDAAKNNAVAQQESAASTLWATYSGIPFVGPAIAAGFIAAMNASLVANAAGAKGIVGAAEGGWFDRPTMAMIGEGKRPELVVPDVAFKDFAANLSANILAQERQAQGYGRQAAGYARGAADAGGGAGAMQEVHVHMAGVTVLDSSLRGLQQLGNHVLDALQVVGGQRGQVLVPGRVVTGGM
jgi:hypothetical protein